MKCNFIIFPLLLSLFSSACMQKQFDESAKRIKDYELKMSPEWVKENILIGKTTEQEVKTIYGKPLNETSMGGVGVQNNIMPDKLISYAVTFSERTNNLQGSYVSRRTTRSLVFSFKNNVVINYNTSSN